MKHVILALFLLAGVVTAADDDASKKLLKSLDGDFKVTSMEKAGQAPEPDFLAKMEKVTIRDGKLTIHFKGNDKSEAKAATLAVDATKKPAHIDLKPDEGADKGNTVVGIVSAEGDTVTMCWADGRDAKRPTEFRTTKENKNYMLTLKRVK